MLWRSLDATARKVLVGFLEEPKTKSRAFAFNLCANVCAKQYGRLGVARKL
jgi:hypothetical protein